jgi:hypothetical protein
MINNKTNLLIISFLLTISTYAQNTYLKFEQTTGTLTNNTQLNGVSQSSGTAATVAQMNDLVYTTGALTTSTINAWVRVDMGSDRTITYVDLAAQSNIANLNGRSIEISTDGVSWTTVVASITGASTSQLTRYTFAPITARFVRVYNPAVTAGIVGVSEFIPETISNLIVAAGQGNTSSKVVDIGFSFMFKGVSYNKFSVNSNGLLRLGTTAATTEAANITRSTANTPKLFAMWDDLSTATLANGGGVRATMTGTSPNRVYTIDWVCTRTNTPGAANLKFQIKLYETSHKFEYIYASSVSTPVSASIGVGGLNAANDYISIVNLGSPAKISYHNFNDNITTWPGTNIVYSFTPLAFTPTETIPSGNLASVENVIGALNWAGINAVPNGGTNFIIEGGHTETGPNALTVAPVSPAGMLLKTSGSIAKPISIEWNGIGAKPIITSGTGNYNWDYMIGLMGVDYITIDGLDLRDAGTNTSNLLRAEIGIGLFKARYNTTLGNDGCDNVQIKNCNIKLTRLPNTAIGDDFQNFSQHHFSRGIFVTHFTNTHAGPYNGTYGHWSNNHYQGIKSAADVHKNCKFTGNYIDDCTYGIEISDGWLKSGANFFAGTNNIVGENGAGNTITNWGADPVSTQVYASSGYNGGTLMAGIIVGGQKDFTIEYNTVSNGISEKGTTSYIQNFAGILAGRTSCNQDFPHHATGFFMKINNNTISSINANINNVAGVRKSALGIVVLQAVTSFGTSAAVAATGNIEINNNHISGLIAGVGNVKGITSSMRLYADYKNALGADNNRDWHRFYSNGDITINNNTILNLRQINLTGNNSTGKGSLIGISWVYPTKRIYIENNTIGGAGADAIQEGIGTNTFLNKHIIGMRGIFVDAVGVNVPTRELVQIKNNTISNLNRVAGTISGQTLQRTSGAGAIFIYKGGINNIVEDNTISDFTIANGLYGAGVNESIDVIKVFGIPKSGNSTVNIINNSITNITRNQFGFLTSMATGSGLNSYTSAINANYSGAAQTKNISNNTINGITQTATYATSAAQQANYYSQLYGIRTQGRNAVNSVINIHDNNISNLSGANWNNAGSLSTTSISQFTTAWNVVGINVADYQKTNIYNNNICELTTTHTGSTSATSELAHGVVGINFGKSHWAANVTKTVLGEAVYNNIIGKLTAPNINSLYAVQGIYYWGYGVYGRIVHNTIALGNPDGGAGDRLSSSTANSFGVSGLSFNNYYWNSKAYGTHFNNNIISVNATPSGSTGVAVYSGTSTGGFATSWRHLTQSNFKSKPLGIDIGSGGNVYFINDHVRNYIYGQGWRYWNSTNGLRNAYGYYLPSPPVSYVNAGRNMVNDISFPSYINEQCGKYKSFWGSPERSSFIDINGLNVFLPIPFENAGATCSDQLKLIDASNTYAGSAEIYNKLLNVNEDAFGTTRGALEVVAGAHENITVNGADVTFINFDFEPICDGVCTGNKDITIKIIPPSGKTIATASGSTAPRIYYRRISNNSTISAAQSDNNIMVNAANNIASGTEGWRWVEPTLISGDDYTFSIDESKLNSLIVSTPTYTIEYFVIAMTTDNLVTSWTSGDFAATNCPTSVDLFNLGGATQVPADSDGDAAILENSISNRYVVYRGADITKTIEIKNNETIYASNNATPINVCLNDSIVIIGNFTITALSETFENECVTYKMQVAEDVAFTTNLETFTSSSNLFSYPVSSSTTTKYVRVSLDCGGSTPANTTTVYTAFRGIECGNITSNINYQTICEGSNMTLTATRAGTVANGNGYLFIDPYGKSYPTITTAVTSGAVAVGPLDTTQTGVWKSIAIIQQIALGAKVQGINHTSLLGAGEESGSVDVGNGLRFDVREPVKINSVVVRDPGNDGLTTTDFNVQITDSTGHVIFEHTGPASVADNGTSTLTFSNLFVPPGNGYAMILAPKNGVDPEGELAVSSGNFPIKVTNGSLTITGGINGGDYTTTTSDYNYFYSWNLTIYCESNSDTFHVKVVPLTAIQSEMPDTINICPYEELSFAPIAIIGEQVVYQWQKRSGITWIDIPTQTDSIFHIQNVVAADAGQYRLKLNGACGTDAISDTVVVNIKALPTKPIATDVFTCGVNINNIEITSNELNTVWYNDPQRNDYYTSGDVIFAGPLSVHDTLYAFNYNDATGCYSLSDTVYIDFVNLLDIPTNTGEHKADAICIDNNGWAHYYQAQNKKLILSIDLDPLELGDNLVNTGWNTLSNDYEVITGVEANKKHLQKSDPAYVINNYGWYVMRRYWKVNTNEIDYTDGSKDIGIKTYFKESDYTDLNSFPVSMTAKTDMSFFKLPHGYDPASSNHDNSPTVDTFYNAATLGGTLTTYHLDSFEILGSKVFVGSHHVTSFSGGGGGAGGSCPVCTPLPVKWLGIAAKWSQNNALVEWKVSSEFNNNKFEILRSIDGIHFYKIGEILSKGNNDQIVQYTFIDRDAKKLNHAIIFYQIKQVDNNGNQSKSKTTILKSDENNWASTKIVLTPNPGNDIVEIFVTSNEKMDFHMDIITAQGQLLVKGIQTFEGINHLDISKYAEGIYFIRIYNDTSFETVKLVITR